jgi:predicted ATPase/class 3 adenylate cyclase
MVMLLDLLFENYPPLRAVKRAAKDTNPVPYITPRLRTIPHVTAGSTHPIDNDAPARTLTFLFADVIGGEQPDLVRLGEIIETATARSSGKMEPTADGRSVCVFETPLDAVDAAHTIQAEVSLDQARRGDASTCQIGIHTGRGSRSAAGYTGPDVDLAARVGASAHGGQVLVSYATRLLVEDHVAQNGWMLVDLGLFDLDGTTDTERLSRVDFPDTPLVMTPPKAKPHVTSSIPTSARPIVGRVADVQSAAELLRRDAVRLVTITGPGGTGKTRLAVELAHKLDPEFPDGVSFVDLAAVRSPDQVLPTVARALGVLESSGRTIIEGLASVVGTARMLLILDNMEQILAAGPDLGQMLEALPGVKLLVTSRAPLRLSWEHEYPLSPLPVPSEGAGAESIAESDAVALFVERARTARPDFALTPDNQQVVAAITRKLDGLPLAIELAAARLGLFAPDELLQRLDDRLAVLDHGNVDLPERHRTLRDAIQWSHELLEEPEARMFRRLGVFSGGWSLDAALLVAVDDELDEGAALSILEELVAKSLVVFAIDDDGEPRYRMLETLREFALERLTESGEDDDIHRRHLAWCLSLASAVEETVATPRFPVLLDQLDRERFNLREALGWSLRTGNEVEHSLLICGNLPLYWDTRGYVPEGLRWSTDLLAAGEPNPTPGRAMTLATVGWLGMLAGDPVLSEESLSGSDDMWRELDDDGQLSRSLSMHGMTTYNLNDFDRAEAMFEESSDLARKAGVEWISDAWCVYGLAHIALARGDMVTADQLLRATLEYSKSRGLTWGIGHAQLSLGVLAFMTGDIGQAVDRMAESLLIREQLQDARGICDCLGMMAVFASVTGDHRFASRLLGAAEVRREATGQIAVPWMQPMLTEATTNAERALGAEFAGGVAEGRALPPAEAIHLAVERMTDLVSSSATSAVG